LVITLHNTANNIPRVLLHFSEHHEVRHDCIGAEDKDDVEDHEEDDESGGSLNSTSNLESKFINHFKISHFSYSNSYFHL